uniref:Uncharacterized protein n=1 Tax=Aegilops tauschii TaxID=37682 RepID=R7W342_AEGTA
MTLQGAPCWLPAWGSAQLNSLRWEPSWATGLEVIFGPGASTTNMHPVGIQACEHVPSVEETGARRALAAANLSGPGLITAITSKVSELHIDEQRAFISKIASLLSDSLLGAPKKTSRPLRQCFLRVVKSPRQSVRLSRQCSNFSSSRRSQAAISVKLGFIRRVEDFNDDTLLQYIHFFRSPMPSENVAKLAEIAGLTSPAQLRLLDDELQAILDELAARAM